MENVVFYIENCQEHFGVLGGAPCCTSAWRCGCVNLRTEHGEVSVHLCVSCYIKIGCFMRPFVRCNVACFLFCANLAQKFLKCNLISKLWFFL